MGLSKKQRALFVSKDREEWSKEWSERKGDDFGVKGVKLPKGCSWFSVKSAGTKIVDVIEYPAGPDNMDADEDYPVPYCRYWRHGGLGSDGRAMVRCLSKAKNPQPCLVCDYISRHGGTMDKPLYEKVKAKERYLWALIDLGDKAKGVQIRDEAPFKGMASAIEALCNMKPKYQSLYANALRGVSLSVQFKDEPGPNGTWLAVAMVLPEPRDKQYTEEIFDKVPVLDQDCFEPVSEKELRKLMTFDRDYFESDQDDAHAGNGKAESVRGGFDDDESEEDDEIEEDEPEDDEEGFAIGDTVKHRRFGACTVVKVHKDGTVNLETEDGDVEEKVRPVTFTKVEGSSDADEEGEEAEEEPKSQKKGKGKTTPKLPKRRPSVDDDEEEDLAPEEDDEPEDDDDEGSAFDDDDDEPLRPVKRTRKK